MGVDPHAWVELGHLFVAGQSIESMVGFWQNVVLMHAFDGKLCLEKDIMGCDRRRSGWIAWLGSVTLSSEHEPVFMINGTVQVSVYRLYGVRTNGAWKCNYFP